ncbi:hypothetical protein FNV43_RR07123 [Rhamnella rubrinervis]|uniref:Trigger factor ribosome-binding bacterial domain-containing protein n=1 Tax=Rhamnella rubrinervis TaxID=2594499 RepID=A0A8K0HFX3_9ROSA|nr:hypothetical protein FNV43_RR07123 [Rhamnella rubrinervis]
MEVGVKTVLLGLNPKIISRNEKVEGPLRNLSWGRASSSHQIRHFAPLLGTRRSCKNLHAVFAVISGAKDVDVSSSQFEDFSVTTTSSTIEPGELQLSIEVSGAKTQTIFDEVFDKMVEEAQPIPGFRRVKGGKTPNVSFGSCYPAACCNQFVSIVAFVMLSFQQIPKDILLEVLGPSKVFKQVITKVINSAVAEYVEKVDLKVIRDLRVEQSFEDLETTFEAGEKFSFSAVLKLQEMN